MGRIRTSLGTVGILRPAGSHRARTSRSWNGRGPTAVLTALALVAGLLGLISPLASAAVKSVSPTVDANNKYPIWYQDANGLRLAPCLDGSDPQCVLPPAGAEPQFDPALPTHFPDNFPSEFFYYLADSDRLATPGCRSSKAGTASIRMAVEGAFASADGLPAANQQVVFGRVRVRVTSGLCPNAPYTFTYPYGQITITANSSGAIPSTLGTTDIGCLAAPCNFSEALASPIFDGFLRWDPAVAPAAPAGYIGDFPTLHPVIGAPFSVGGVPANYFRIDGERVTGLQTNQFNLSGRIAGPLVSSPTTLDLGGQDVGTTGAPRTVTLTNVGADPLTISGFTLSGANAGSFAADSQTCTGGALAQDGSCTVGITFSPSAEGVQTAVLQVAHDRLGSPFTVNLTGTGTPAGAGAVATPDPASLTFGQQRIGVVSPSKRVTVTNTGTAPLEVSRVQLTGPNAADFIVFNDACTNAVVQAGTDCVIDVAFLPRGLDARTASLDIASNVAPVSVGLTGTGIGGVAAVSTGIQPTSGYPEWYQDENGVRVSPCTDGTDPFCVLPAAGDEPLWNPALPPDMTTDPVNFPSEFFYQLSDSDVLTTPGCGTIAPGRAFIRMALEGAFLGLGGPVQGEQIVFGRIRVFASGLCPNTEYQFINPYGVERFTTNDAGTVTRVAGTEDIGCLAVVPPATCNFADALQSRVLAGFLRWDPSLAPAAPPGYLGDALTLHRVIGGSYIPPGETAAVDYFRIVPSADPGTPIGETNLWTISGKLAGPLVSDQGDVAFPPTVVGDTSPATTVTITNAGASAVTIGTATITGDFAFETGGDQCSGATLDPTATASCTIALTFTPTATGNRSGQLSVPHSGLNTPLVVGLHGLGQAVGTPAISLTPTQLTFGSQHTGTSSVPQTVTISNNGGAADLHIASVTSDSTSFTITGNTCDATTLTPNVGDCTVDVSFTPTVAGALTGNLLIDDDAPGNPHSVPLSGTGFAGTPAVSAAVDANHGFPLWYQDANGTRVEPCIEGADPRCVLPGAPFDPGQPTVFPSNFPDEFFYWLADSDPVTVDGGAISIRMALEGTTAGVAGDQLVFGRIRIKAVGVAANATYTVVHPFGTDTLTTDADGGGVLTQDIGCLAGPCNFAEALASPVLGGFLRWDPRFGAAPAGYLGDALTPHRVVGAPFSVGGVPANFFRVMDSTGSTVLGETNLFTVAGRMAAALRATPTALDFGDQVVTTTSAGKTVDVTNQGITPVTISVTVNGDYAIGAANTCTGSLASDATCTVPVTFTPTADGPRTGLLTITSDTGASTTVALTGNGTGPMAVDPTSLNFGDVERDHVSPAQTVTYTNLGAADVSVTAVNFTGDFSQTGGTCSATTTLAQNGTCTVEVTFHPTVPDGPKTGSLSLVHSGANSPLSVDLAGVGTAPPHAVAQVTPASIAFGEQRVNTSSAAQPVTVKNVGAVDLLVQNVVISGANASDFLRTNGCSVPVPVGGQCTIDVVFQPAATGARSATLTITSNASPSTNTVDLTGTGVQPVSAVSPASVAFASQRVGTTSAAQTVTVTNSGTGQMTVSGVSLIGQNPTSFTSTNNCSTGLGANQSCTIDVRFAPAATGALSASLRIVTNTAQSPQTVALTGTGVASAVSLSNTTLSFGNVRVGSTSSKTLTIQNTGTATLNFTSFTISGGNAAANYTITSNTCAGVAIAVRGKCSIAIRFAPTATGSRTANLVLVDDAPNSPQTVALTGNGR